MSDMNTCVKCHLPLVYGGNGQYCKCNYQPAAPNPFDPAQATITIRKAEYEAMRLDAKYLNKIIDNRLWVTFDKQLRDGVTVQALGDNGSFTRWLAFRQASILDGGRREALYQAVDETLEAINAAIKEGN